MAGNRGISPGVYEIPARRRLAKFIIPLITIPLPPSLTLSVNVAAFKSLQFTSGYCSNFSSPFPLLRRDRLPFVPFGGVKAC